MLGLVLTICHKREVVAEITSMPWKPFALLGYFLKNDEEYFSNHSLRMNTQYPLIFGNEVERKRARATLVIPSNTFMS